MNQMITRRCCCRRRVLSATAPTSMGPAWAPQRLASTAASPPPAATAAKRNVLVRITALDDEGDALGTTLEDHAGESASASSSPCRRVRVPFAVPGDLVTASVWNRDLADTRDPQRAIFGELTALRAPSPLRVTPPPCAKFFGTCGGCRHQNVHYAEQLAQKQRRIEALFARVPLRAGPIAPILGCDEQLLLGYRNKMEFTCSTGRWLLASDMPSSSATNNDNDGDNVNGGDDASDPNAVVGAESNHHLPAFTLGLFPVASVGARRARTRKKRHRYGQWSARLLAIDECLLQDPVGNVLLEDLTSRCEALGITAYDHHAHEGFLKHVIIRRGIGAGGAKEIMLGLVTSSIDEASPQQRLLRGLIEDLVEAHPHLFSRDPTAPTDENATTATAAAAAAARVVSIVQRLDEEAARHRRRRGEAVPEVPAEALLWGQPYFHDTILGHRFEVSLDSFFQPNTAQATKLYARIKERLTRATTPRRTKPVVWDLFCGVGSIGICLGSEVQRLFGFELVDAAVAKARRNARLNGYSNEHMHFQRLDLSNHWDAVEAELVGLAEMPRSRPDVIIVDPPRAGLHKKLVRLLRRLGPREICYVSCNPETQVRDLELLCTEGLYETESLEPVDMLPHTAHIETIAWLRRSPTTTAEASSSSSSL